MLFSWNLCPFNKFLPHYNTLTTLCWSLIDFNFVNAILPVLISHTSSCTSVGLGCKYVAFPLLYFLQMLLVVMYRVGQKLVHFRSFLTACDDAERHSICQNVWRIFNCDEIQNTTLNPFKVLYVLIYGSPFCVIMYTSHKCLIWFSFLPTLYTYICSCIAVSVFILAAFISSRLSVMRWSLPVERSITYLMTYILTYMPFLCRVHWSYPMWQLNVVACMNFGDGLNSKFRHTGRLPNFFEIWRSRCVNWSLLVVFFHFIFWFFYFPITTNCGCRAGLWGIGLVSIW